MHSMEWSEIFDKEREPSDSQIQDFVVSPLWVELADYLQQAYKTQPKLSYSNCSMDKGFFKGWNVKYKKSGKALCTLYPKQGCFFAMVVIGERELPEADLLISLCDKYTQRLYADTETGMGGKWLMIEVKSVDILRDLKDLIALKVKPK